MKHAIFAVVLLLCAGIASAASNRLDWDFPVAEEAKTTEFSIERKAAACAATSPAFAEIATVAKTLRTFTDSAAVEGVTYCYQIRAEGPGGFSPYSNQVARTVPFTAPAAPSNLRVGGGP